MEGRGGSWEGEVLADDLDFGFEVDAAFATGGLADAGDEFEDLGGGGAAFVDDEVAVDRGDLGWADGGFFEAEFLDEFTGGASGWVFEDAASGGGDGLGGFAFIDAELEVGVDDLGGCGGALEDSADAVLVVEFGDTAVADEDFVAGFFLNGA